MIESTFLSEVEKIFEEKKHFSVAELFEEVVEKYPENIALVHEDKTLTYKQLNTKANQLAYFLSVEKGITKGSVVGFYADPSDWTIISILAILKIGGIYLPIDSKYPEERIRYMIADSDIKYLIIESLFSEILHIFDCPFTLLEELEKKTQLLPVQNLAICCNSSDIAYVMYTSGTTGKPNGVLVPQSGIIRLVYSSYIPFSDKLVILQLAPLGFDASTFEIWGALLHGARLVIYGNHLPEFYRIRQFIHHYKISCLWLTAALFNAIIDESPELLSGVKFLLTGGEALSVHHIKKAQKFLSETHFINGYGPTECTTFTCCYPIPDLRHSTLKSIPIGKAITATGTYILNDNLKLVAKGEIGELFVTGAGVALGYQNNEALTNERFVEIDIDGIKQRAYKTGDLCVELPDGTIDFVGRKDSQVKINGFRIEIGEIEVCLRNYLYVVDAVVLIKDYGVTKKIVAYVVPRSTNINSSTESVKVLNLLDRKALAKHLTNWLPGYMIPNEIIELTALPININGKIDRKALLLIESDERINSEEDTFKGIDLEIKQLCEKILTIKISNRSDNFFELGAESLSIAQLLFHLSQEYGINIPISSFYFDPSLENLINLLNNQHSVEHKFISDHIEKSNLLFDSLEMNNITGFVNPLSVIKLKEGDGTPLFVAPGMLGNAFFFIEFSKNLNTDNPLYIFEYPTRSDGSIVVDKMEELATYFITNIKEIQPNGAYQLLGFSFGGRLIFEIAKQLEQANDKISFLSIVDSEGFYPKKLFNYSKSGFELYVILRLPLKLIPDYIANRPIAKAFQKISNYFRLKKEPAPYESFNRKILEKDYLKIWYNHYTTYRLLSDLFLIIGAKEERDSLLYYAKIISPDLFFRPCIAGNLEISHVNCDHMGFFKNPHIFELTELIENKLLGTIV